MPVARRANHVTKVGENIKLVYRTVSVPTVDLWDLVGFYHQLILQPAGSKLQCSDTELTQRWRKV